MGEGTYSTGRGQFVAKPIWRWVWVEVSARRSDSRIYAARRFQHRSRPLCKPLTRNNMASTTIATERRAARFWWFFIFALMGINLAMAVAAIVLSAGDPSFRPMPEYGEHAVDWQSRKTQLEASSRLGWQLQVERHLGAAQGDPVAGDDSKQAGAEQASVRIQLRDAQGVPIQGATGTLGAYHLTRVSEFRTAALEPIEVEPGGYKADINVSRDGKWQLSIDLRDGNGQAFVWQQVVDWSSP